MKNSSVFRLILIIIISVLLGYYLGVNKVSFDWKNYKPKVTVVSKEPPLGVSNVDFSLFWTVWEKLETQYYDKLKLDSQQMLNGAISGLVQSLGDPYTIYLPKTQNNSFKEGLAGQFSGIGAELGTSSDKEIIVIAPLTGSPAEKAGVKPGDAIVKVDGSSTANWTLSQAVSKIRGPKGTTVALTVLHKDSKTPNEIKIVRDTITVKSVDGWVKKVRDIEGITHLAGSGQASIKGREDEEIAYIRLSQFGDSTNQDWLSLINKLYTQIQKDQPFGRQDNTVKGMILDLRNNPGGYLNDAVFIAGEFLKQGTPVVIEDSAEKGQRTLSVSRKGVLYDIPLIVLINKGSASASEIVSGALMDNNRAILMGETSFGKGTIQQAEDLGDGVGLHITIAKWLTPKGVWVNEKGLTPDIQVSLNSNDSSRDTQLEKAVAKLIE